MWNQQIVAVEATCQRKLLPRHKNPFYVDLVPGVELGNVPNAVCRATMVAEALTLGESDLDRYEGRVVGIGRRLEGREGGRDERVR